MLRWHNHHAGACGTSAGSPFEYEIYLLGTHFKSRACYIDHDDTILEYFATLADAKSFCCFHAFGAPSDCYGRYGATLLMAADGTVAWAIVEHRLGGGIVRAFPDRFATRE